jgi:hypothetical protein
VWSGATAQRDCKQSIIRRLFTATLGFPFGRSAAHSHTEPALVPGGGGVHLRSPRADKNDLRNAIGGEALSE